MHMHIYSHEAFPWIKLFHADHIDVLFAWLEDEKTTIEKKKIIFQWKYNCN